ncbi:MAG: polyprenyl synthetase family protein [Chloroflexota bacterium]
MQDISAPPPSHSGQQGQPDYSAHSSEYYAFVPLADAFARYRPALDASLRSTFQGRELPLYEMLRYHLGLDVEGVGAGKALRPTLCLLVCDALGGHWLHAVPAAVSLELIHNFSLVHDDIQDHDLERRHRPALWTRWGVAQGINAGDAMFCMATLTLCQLKEQFAPAQVVDAVCTVHEAAGDMIEGQYLDMTFESQATATLPEYLEMIGRKTGALLRASMELGSLLAGAAPEVRRQCRELGETMGELFQIRDDVLGVWGTTEQTGKPVHSDIRRRKKSMPIVIAAASAHPAQREDLRKLYRAETLSDDAVACVLRLFDELNVRQQIQRMTVELHQRARALAEATPFASPGAEELLSIVDFLLTREY